MANSYRADAGDITGNDLMTIQNDVKKLYLEVTSFLSKSGGAYLSIDTQTYRDLIDAIISDQFRLIRNESGEIVSFTSWWMIHEADLDAVKNGRRPDDITNGTIVYVADHGGIGGRLPGLIKFIRSTIGRKGVCWHHRYKHPEQFRYYPKKEGTNAQHI